MAAATTMIFRISMRFVIGTTPFQDEDIVNSELLTPIKQRKAWVVSQFELLGLLTGLAPGRSRWHVWRKGDRDNGTMGQWDNLSGSSLLRTNRRAEKPRSIAFTAGRRRSTDRALAMQASLFSPSTHLESEPLIRESQTIPSVWRLLKKIFQIISSGNIENVPPGSSLTLTFWNSSQRGYTVCM
jgi:hypothetical protein